MKLSRIILSSAAIALIATLVLPDSSQAARSSGGKRYGLGVNLGRADVRYELDSMSAVDGFIGLSSVDAGGGVKTSDTSIGGYYLKRFFAPDPVDFHLVAGLSFGTGSTSTTVPLLGTISVKNSIFSVFVGVGSEYFLPGTKQFSLSAEVGLAFDSTSTDVPNILTAGTTSVSGSSIGLRDLTGGVFMLRYYFAN